MDTTFISHIQDFFFGGIEDFTIDPSFIPIYIMLFFMLLMMAYYVFRRR